MCTPTCSQAAPSRKAPLASFNDNSPTGVGAGSTARAELQVDGVAMVRLLGPQDRLLTTIEHQFPEVTVLVRGNQVTLEGPPGARSQPPSGCQRAHPAGQERRRSRPRRCDELGPHPGARGGQPGRGAQPGDPHRTRQEHPPQDPRAEGVRRRDRRAHHHVRHRPGRNRQDLPRDGEGRAGAAAQRGRAHHPDPARRSRRGSGSASCPAR